MPRARSIKPGFFKNEILAELPMVARLLFIGLWCLADREGRLEDRPKRIKIELLPLDDADVSELLQELQQAGFIVRYKVGCDKFIQILNFVKHQMPHHKEAASEIPAPPGYSQATRQPPDAQSKVLNEVAAREGNTTKIHARVNVDSTLNQRCVNESAPCPTDSGLLTPDSGLLNPESLGVGERAGAQDPPTHPELSPEYREVIETERPDLDAPLVWRLFSEHYPERSRTIAQWTRWVRTEFEPRRKPAVPASTADPDSRAAIEAIGLSIGIGKWDELAETWAAYKARVRGVKA